MISPANAAPNSSPARCVSRLFFSFETSFTGDISAYADQVYRIVPPGPRRPAVIDAKLGDLYQTKVESGSKYRLRLSGIVLLNMYDNRGQSSIRIFRRSQNRRKRNHCSFLLARSVEHFAQSQIRLQAFGPDIGGARTSADLHFDFAGGFPNTLNGVARVSCVLRTGRFDWIGPILPLSPGRTVCSSHRWLPHRSPHSLFPRSPIAGTFVVGTASPHRHRIVLSEASSFLVPGRNPRFPLCACRRILISAIHRGAKNRASPLMRRGFPGVHHAFGQNLTVGWVGTTAARTGDSAETWTGGLGPRMLRCRSGNYLSLPAHFTEAARGRIGRRHRPGYIVRRLVC